MLSARRTALLKYGADVAVIGEHPTPALIQAEADGLLTLERRPYARGDMAGAVLVICIDSSEGIRREVFSEAESSGCSRERAGRAGVVELQHAERRAPRGATDRDLHRRSRARGRQADTDRAEGAVRRGVGRVRRAHGRASRDSLTERVPAEERRAVLEAVADSDVLDRIRDGRAPEPEALLREFAVRPEAESQPHGDSSEVDPEPSDSDDPGSGEGIGE